MHIKCPDCYATFHATTEQLKVAEGMVRCDLCFAIFSSQTHLHVSHEQSVTTVSVSHGQEQKSYKEANPTANAYYQPDNESLVGTEKVPTVIRDDFGKSLPSKSTNPVQIALWTAGSIALAIFFLGQITYWQNIDVLPRIWVDNFCAAASCQPDIERDLSAIKILNRSVYTHPNVDNALMIASTFVNEGGFPQPFPLLQVAFLDTQGEVVAFRRFTPEDYLISKIFVTNSMQPDQPIEARLEIFDPGSAVVAYKIEFY